MEPIYMVVYQEQCGMACEMDTIGVYRNGEDAVRAMCKDVGNGNVPVGSESRSYS